MGSTGFDLVEGAEAGPVMGAAVQRLRLDEIEAG